jgi:hypothetical protein
MAIYKSPLDMSKDLSQNEYEYSPYDRNVKVKAAIHNLWMDNGGYEEDENGNPNELNINEFITRGNPSKEDVNELYNYLTEFNNHKAAKILKDNYNSFSNGGGLNTRQSVLENEFLNAPNSEEYLLGQIGKYREPMGNIRDKQALERFFNAKGYPLKDIDKYRSNPDLYKGSVARALFDKYFSQGGK